MKYRALNEQEIAQLKLQGCRSKSWDKIHVVNSGFDCSTITNCSFSGEVKLGASLDNSEIHNAKIDSCTIGDGVTIYNIGSWISNYDICDRALISGVNIIETTEISSFGNGVEVATINEGGGREVAIFNSLSAHFAYIMAMYRGRTTTSKRLKQIIDKYIDGIKSDRGRIGVAAKITGCGTIRNVNVGDFATLSDTTMLSNGSVNSTQDDPCYVGAGVKCYDFIISPGAVINNGSIVKRCFIGEACHIDDGFTAVDSLFFANSDCANGEACSIFAGPYTVSHHKSSLLIAGIFSFFNAGSGTNQSNHLFKMGAVHQGIHERGCKFASNGYTTLPAREGAFTVLIGRHSKHHDTHKFPFSYLMESDGASVLMPAANLKSYGTVRDMAKWELRDKRKSAKTDHINFERYNPYIGERLFEAIELSNKLLESGKETVMHNRVKIKQSSLSRGLKLYEMAYHANLAALLKSPCEIQEVPNINHWGDIAGMYAPMSLLNSILDRVDCSDIDSTKEFDREIDKIYANYSKYSYLWAVNKLTVQLGHKPTQEDIDAAISGGDEAVAKLLAINISDGEQDTGVVMSTGYGVDCLDKEDIMADFKAVRKLK